MGIAYYVSAAIVLCFTLSTVNVISGDTSVDCTTFDNNTCCSHVECFYVNCTNKTDDTKTHLGCHAKTDVAGITEVCKNGTDKHICDGPAVIENACNFTTMDTCCNNTVSGCVWLNCTDQQEKEYQGCHNSTDTTGITAVCKEEPVFMCFAPTPVDQDCVDFGKNQSECCKHKDSGCVFVNCSGTKPADKFDGCFNSTAVTCKSMTDQCKLPITTTVATTTTIHTTVKPTTLPYFKECQTFTDVPSCCTEAIWSCIYVNCSGFKGCYSKSNETDIKAKCGKSYLDACTPTTPVPGSTTAAPSTGGDTGHHFDAASFIGGIVLCAGIVLIIFFALKWYKSRQSSNNYHQM